jgi:hypothetical protein
MPHGTAMLVDPRTIYVAIGLTGYMRVLLETYAANDQTGLLIVSRFDAGVTIPAGLVVSGLGPNETSPSVVCDPPPTQPIAHPTLIAQPLVAVEDGRLRRERRRAGRTAYNPGEVLAVPVVAV